MPERPRRVRLLAAARLRERARRAVHGGAPRLHHRAPVGLLVVGGADHEDLALEAEQRARERERGAPLPGAGLRAQPPDARPRVLVGLRHRRVGLVRAGRRDALVLVVDVRRGVELALEAPRAEQRRGAPQPVGVAHLLGDVDERLGRDLLFDQPHREDREQVRRARGLHRLRGAAAAAARRGGPRGGSPTASGCRCSASRNFTVSSAICPPRCSRRRQRTAAPRPRGTARAASAVAARAVASTELASWPV